MVIGGISLDLWRCGKCGDVYGRGQLAAGQCCNWKCADCNCAVPNFYTRCDVCSRNLRAKRDQETLDKATVVENYDGWVYAHQGIGPQDGYFPSLEDFIEWIEENCECNIDEKECTCLPEYVHTCRKEVRELDIHKCIADLCEGGYEDMGEGIEPSQELLDAVEKFNKANENSLTLYEVDTKHKVAVSL
jgi:hypothetical protein